MQWALQKQWAMRLRKHASDSRSPELSAATDVIRTSGSPHATTHENGSRSFSTLTAKPCVEIAARDVHAERGDLAILDPHAGVVGAVVRSRARDDADLAERGDDRVLHRAQVRDDVGDGHDRVAHQLAGAVVGDAPAAVGVDHVDAFGAVEVLAERQTRRRRSAVRACTRAGARAAAACRGSRRTGAGRGVSPGWPRRRSRGRGPGGRPRAHRRLACSVHPHFSLATHHRGIMTASLLML